MREKMILHGRRLCVAAPTALIVKGFVASAAAAQTPLAPTRAALGDWNVVDVVKTLIFGLLILGVALVVARRRKPPPSEDAHEKQVSDAIAAILPAIEEGSRLSIVPRTLPRSPFNIVSAPLESQIEIAAEACVRLSRTIGVIYFEIPAYAEIEQREGRERADEIVAALAEAMRHYLRATDHVAVRDGNQIIVCICLLDKASDLESVAKRLAVVVQRHKLGGEEDALVRPGLAVYPMHGYRGSDLIDAARRSHRAGRGDATSQPWVGPAEIEALDASLRPQAETKPPSPSRAKSKFSVVAKPPDEQDPPP